MGCVHLNKQGKNNLEEGRRKHRAGHNKVEDKEEQDSRTKNWFFKKIK